MHRASGYSSRVLKILISNVFFEKIEKNLLNLKSNNFMSNLKYRLFYIHFSNSHLNFHSKFQSKIPKLAGLILIPTYFLKSV